MRRSLLFALLASAAVGPSVYSLLGGNVGFTAPDGWREVARTDSDTSSFVAFVVPRPAADPSAPAGNVMIQVAVGHGPLDLAGYSADRIADVKRGPGEPVVVESRYLPDSTRTVRWASRLRGTPYDLWDKYAVRDSFYIYVRTAIPSSYAADPAWKQAYEAGLESLIKGICAGDHPFFSAEPSRCPDIRHILPFSPDENEDGARFLWLIERHSGLPRPYVSARDLPNAPFYREVSPDSARAGDVVQWPTLVGVYNPETRGVLTLEEEKPLASLIPRLGRPRYFRRLVPE